MPNWSCHVVLKIRTDEVDSAINLVVFGDIPDLSKLLLYMVASKNNDDEAVMLMTIIMTSLWDNWRKKKNQKKNIPTTKCDKTV